MPIQNIFIFNPRKNNVDMKPQFYDSQWTPQPYGGDGPEIANPYNQNSSNALIRQSNYLWGRYYESFLYSDYKRAGRVWWSISPGSDAPGYVETQHNGSYYSEGFEDFTFWYRASLHDYNNPIIGLVSYINSDNLIRYVQPSEVGQFVSFYDANRNIEFGGIIEDFRSVNDYDISYLDTTQYIYPNPEPVHTLTITNNQYQGVIGNVIANYRSQFQNPGPIIMGHTIGYKPKTLLYNKRYNDMRRGIY